MIRKFGSVDFGPSEARRIALAAESWSQWMPNIRSTRVLESSQQRILVEVQRVQGRRVHKTRLELLPNSTGYTELQVSGLAKRWDLDWQFRPAPSGVGTVISCKFDVDFGFFGLFVSRRTVQRAVDKTFDKILRGLEAQASRDRSERPDRALEPESSLEDVRHIRIFTTESGLEIWLGDSKYVAERVHS